VFLKKKQLRVLDVYVNSDYKILRISLMPMFALKGLINNEKASALIHLNSIQFWKRTLKKELYKCPLRTTYSIQCH